MINIKHIGTNTVVAPFPSKGMYSDVKTPNSATLDRLYISAARALKIPFPQLSQEEIDSAIAQNGSEAEVIDLIAECFLVKDLSSYAEFKAQFEVIEV